MNLKEDDMSDSERAKKVSEIVDKATKQFIAEGRLMESGFTAYCIMCLPDDTSEAIIEAFRTAYFSGAQHLWATVMRILDPGGEPTEADLVRMDKIDTELREFYDEMKQRYPS